MGTFSVYIMASRSRVLYVGVTNDLARRTNEHKRGLVPGFTSRYRITRLVYFEEFVDILDAIAREKEIKGWVRPKRCHPERRRRACGAQDGAGAGFGLTERG
jgi:putative endonuclease